MDIILYKIGLVRINFSSPSILYFVVDMFLKLMEGYVLLKKKKRKKESVGICDCNYSYHCNDVLCIIIHIPTQMNNMAFVHHTLTHVHQVAITHVQPHIRRTLI